MKLSRTAKNAVALVIAIVMGIIAIVEISDAVAHLRKTLVEIGVLTPHGLTQQEAEELKRLKREIAKAEGVELREKTSDPMYEITRRVATDAEEQFRISLTGKDPIEICVHAGLVTAAHLQAKNPTAYRRWKEIERKACAIAGIQK